MTNLINLLSQSREELVRRSTEVRERGQVMLQEFSTRLRGQIEERLQTLNQHPVVQRIARDAVVAELLRRSRPITERILANLGTLKAKRRAAPKAAGRAKKKSGKRSQRPSVSV